MLVCEKTISYISGEHSIKEKAAMFLMCARLLRARLCAIHHTEKDGGCTLYHNTLRT